MFFKEIKRKNAVRGFTLLEMMVVLVIISLITVLLMQGFSFIAGLQERIRQQLSFTQEIELREQWFRLVVRSYHRGRKADQASFEGRPNEMSGIVLQPLNGDVGVPTQVTWRIEQQGSDSFLYYQEAQNAPVKMMSWAKEIPEFRYIDTNGNLIKDWPSSNNDNIPSFQLNRKTDTTALPRGVALLDTSGEGKLFWYVSISSNTPAVVDFGL
jgi:general secretion pathway protein J